MTEEYISEEQRAAIDAIDSAIEKVVALGDSSDARKVISNLESAKSKIVWGSFPNGG